jgi:hypothetical protein
VANRPYTKDMKHEARETMPPTREELEGLERFERSEMARSKSAPFWAQVEAAARALGLK